MFSMSAVFGFLVSLFFMVASFHDGNINVLRATNFLRSNLSSYAVTSNTLPPRLSNITGDELKHMIDLANEGNVSAQMKIAQRFHWANFPETWFKDINLEKWGDLEKKAQENYQFAYLLIMMGYIKKLPSLVNYIEMRAKKGDAEWQNLYGILFAQGYGIEKNKEVALEWFQKAADQNFAPGNFNIGLFYLDREVGNSEPGDAVPYFVKAAKQGYAVAEFFTGLMYLQGTGGTERIPNIIGEALKLLRKSAEKGFAQAETYLAIVEMLGAGDKLNSEKLEKLFTKPANMREEGAVFILNKIKEHKKDEPITLKMAREWLSQLGI